MTKMASLGILFLGFLAIGSASTDVDPRDFDSRSMIAVDATLADGKMVTSTAEPVLVEAQIRLQLRYLVGVLFDDASPALNHSLKTTVKEIKERGDGLKEISYQAQFLLAWNRRGANVKGFSGVVPLRADDKGLNAFDEKYISRCGGKPPLWYYYRPGSSFCPVAGRRMPEDVVRLDFTLKQSPLNTSGKSPEYEKIFEDGLLSVLYVSGNTDSEDGPSDYLERALSSTFGNPVKSDTQTFENYQVKNLEYESRKGKVHVQGMDILRGNIQTVDTKFKELFGSKIASADLVGYNGHAGLGANIAAFTKLAAFTPKRYYLYWLNACKPFFHLDPTLFNATKMANPTAPHTKYLDVMSIAHVGGFSFGRDMVSIVLSLAAKKATFREILHDGIAPGNPVVMGEEDNRWPEKFEP